MAATITDLANGVSTTANTTLATGATVTAAVGDFLLALIACDNNGSGGAAPGCTLADSDGVNTYSRRQDFTYDPGAQQEGVTLYAFTCKVKAALSNDMITATFGANVSQKAMAVWKIAPGASETVKIVSIDLTGQIGSATSHAANTVSVASGDIIFGFAGIETDDAVTGDSDTTNGSWSALNTRLADAGVDADAMVIASQHKTTTGSGNQSWTATTASARDSARAYIVLRSTVPAGVIKKAQALTQKMAA